MSQKGESGASFYHQGIRRVIFMAVKSENLTLERSKSTQKSKTAERYKILLL